MSHVKRRQLLGLGAGLVFQWSNFSAAFLPEKLIATKFIDTHFLIYFALLKGTHGGVSD